MCRELNFQSLLPLLSSNDLQGGMRGRAVTDWRSELQAKSIHLIPGVGPERAARLAEMGIHDVFDLLFYFPFRYETTIDKWNHDGTPEVDAVFVVDGEVTVRMRGRKSTVSTWVKSGEARAKALFFNQPYLRHQLQKGVQLRLKGKYDEKSQTILVSRYEMIKKELTSPTIIPVYRANAYFGQLTLRKIIQEGVHLFLSELGEDIPSSLRDRFRLVTLQKAVHDMHFPDDREALRQARRRLVFEEFLRFQLEVQSFRKYREKFRQPSLSFDQLTAHAEAFLNTLPFSLTRGQRSALSDMLADIASELPMHRLLHGEVGAGKTLVVFAAAAALTKMGYQTAMMVPTSVLAWQHAESAKKWLEPFGIRVGFISGLLTAQERSRLFSEISRGNMDVIIGTQVLTREDLAIPHLRLIVIDEQHRFGVMARKLLRQKGEATDVLQMTATPIPRTYALTIYGDVEVSALHELPPGRIPVKTNLLDPGEEAKAIRFVRHELARGKQAFVIAPRIDPPEQNEDFDFSAKTLFTRLEEEWAGFSLGLVHGNMPEPERMRIMDDFARGDVKVLVATTIIEVGVNVPNANVILIYGGDRFGLATLHQLRGRVGRSQDQAYCVVIAKPETEYGRARLAAFLQSDDGFYLAEQDLRLRGPGEAFGERQSGIPVFQVGDVIRDMRAMQTARQVVQEWLNAEDFWLLPEYAPLRQVVTQLDDWHADA